MKWSKVISLIFVVSAGISCIGCGDSIISAEKTMETISEESFTATVMSPESSKENESSVAITTSQAVDEKPDGEIASTVIGKGYGSWQQAYIAYIEKKIPDNTSCTYSLIHLDNDDVPELFINSGFELGGETVLSYYDDRLTEQILSRIGSTYIPYTGLIYNDCGHMGYLPAYVFKLAKGDFYKLGEGLREENYNDKGEAFPTFTWEGVSCSEEEYYSNIRRLFPDNMGDRPFDWYSRTEMMSILNTGHITSYGHRYEIIVGDMTWEEARQVCNDKGGYLATITSYEERKTAADLMEECGVTEYGLYVGYKTHYWINKDGSLSEEILDINYSEYAEPDYDVKKKEWKNERTQIGLLKYRTYRTGSINP